MAAMFETTDFQNLLDNAVSSEAGLRGLASYQTSIVTYLQDLASGNERFLMEDEMRKSASTRRGTGDALNSARVLVKEASAYASADRRTTLELADIEKAYRAKFCQVWPFCR